MKLNKNIIIVTSFIITSLFVMSCNKKNEDPVKQVEKAQQQIIDNKSAIIEINGEIFYDKDFYSYNSVVLKELDPKDYNNAEIKKNLIDDFIEHNLLLQEAKRRNVKVDEKEVGVALYGILNDSGAQDLKVYSGSYDTSTKELAKRVNEKMLIESLIYNVVNSEIEVSDNDIKNAYNQMYANAEPIRKAHLYQIYTKEKGDAEKALAELKRGLAFNEVAKRYSAGPEKENGGDLGYVVESDFPEIFSNAFKLRAGQFSDIIRSEYGYHIFLIKSYERVKKEPLNKVKEEIHFKLYNQEQDSKIKEFIDVLYKNATITYLHDISLDNYTRYKSK